MDKQIFIQTVEDIKKDFNNQTKIIATIKVWLEEMKADRLLLPELYLEVKDNVILVNEKQIDYLSLPEVQKVYQEIVDLIVRGV
jgi:archaellum component FlaC